MRVLCVGGYADGEWRDLEDGVKTFHATVMPRMEDIAPDSGPITESVKYSTYTVKGFHVNEKIFYLGTLAGVALETIFEELMITYSLRGSSDARDA